MAAVPKRALQESLRVAIYKVGEEWWAEILPLHFTNKGYSLYGYTKRQPGYDRAKRMRRANGEGRRAIGEVKPNVWSGESRERATSTKNIVARAPSSRSCHVTVIIDAPALNFRSPRSTIHPRSEVVKIIPVELAKLEQTYQAEIVADLNRRGYEFRNVKIFRAA